MKIGEQNYHLGRFMNRGVHELSNAIVFPDSNVPLRDHSGLYSKENQQPENAKEPEPQAPPEKEQEAPDLER